MSVLIRGMEMPTSCLSCDFMMNCDDCEGYECYCTVLNRCIGYLPSSSPFLRDGVSLVHSDDRLEDCPLVPVPEHGRLVDLTEIKRRIASCCGDIDCSKIKCDECAVQIAMNKMFTVPTIIPAEEGET